MRRVQTSEFPALSIYYTPTELGVGPQRNESCAAISVTCNRTRDWLAWTIGLRYLVVSCPDPFRKIEKGSGHETSVCQFVNIRYPIKGACRVTVWAIVGAMPYILWGNCPHCPPPPQFHRLWTTGCDQRTHATSPGPPNFLGPPCDFYFIYTFLRCFFLLCFPLHCLDSMSEHLGRIISNAFTVSVEI